MNHDTHSQHAITTPSLEHAHTLVMLTLEWFVLAINATCALVLVLGVAVGLRQLILIHLVRRNTSTDWAELRVCVGRYLLVGLELLIAADVIETMIRPTLVQLAILAGVSAIRIATGFALSKELEALAHDQPIRHTGGTAHA